jgi:hypothetical protein
MSRALAYLGGLPISLQNKEYSLIVKLANDYLKKYCQHEIVEDYIDTAPESCKKIFYCELCYKTFPEK